MWGQLLVSRTWVDHQISSFCKHTGHISCPKNHTILCDSYSRQQNNTSVFSRHTTNKLNNRMHPPLKSLPPSPFLPSLFRFHFCLVFLLFFPSLLLTSSTTQAYNQQGHHALEHTHRFMLVCLIATSGVSMLELMARWSSFKAHGAAPSSGTQSKDSGWQHLMVQLWQNNQQEVKACTHTKMHR